jgi:hypothetical protein
MDPTTRLKSFAQLVQFLTDNHFPHAVDPAHQIVELPSKAAPLPGNLILQWSTTVPFLQIVHFMLGDVPADRVPALEDALVRMNNLYEVPGFGYEHKNRRLYYRLAVPVLPDDGISPTTLNALGQGVVKAGKEFLEPLKAVIAGRGGDEIEAIIVEMKKQN